MNDPDIEYMMRLKDGDESGFQALFNKYGKKIVNFCYRFHPDVQWAEEQAQEVFLRVYKAASGYRPEARFSTWLFRIATNVCLNELRRGRYRYRTETIDIAQTTDEGTFYREIGDDPKYQPDALYQEQEQQKKVQHAISSLPEKQRAALLLRISYGFSYDEIGKQIGCTVSSVKSLIHRGRQGLIGLIKAE